MESLIKSPLVSCTIWLRSQVNCIKHNLPVAPNCLISHMTDDASLAVVQVMQLFVHYFRVF